MKGKIIDYLENELSPQERKDFEAALTTDMELQKAFAFQKAQWEKLAMLRSHAKAADFLKSYNESEMVEALPKPKLLAWMTVRRVRYAAIAAAVLLFLFNYNSLIHWIKPNISKEASPDIVAEKPVVTPVAPAPSVAPVTPISPAPATTVEVPTPPKPNPKFTLPAPPQKKQSTTEPSVLVQTPTIPPTVPEKVGSATSKDSIFLTNLPKKDTLNSKMPLDGSTISLDNMYDFKGDNGLISKHLSEISCNNYTVSFLIKRDGTVDNPKFEKGDKNCETALLNQIKTMPRLKKPIYDGKAVDYRYFFTKK